MGYTGIYQACGAGDPLSESDIVREVLEGDTDSFRRIVEAYETRLRAYCAARLPPSEVDDAAQDVFIKCFRSLKSYDPSKPFGAWFFAIARTHIATRKLRFWRDRTKTEALSRTEVPYENGNGGQALLEAAMARELVARLKGGQREAVELHYFAGLTVREVALALSIGESAVKQRLARARAEMLAIAERGDPDSKGGRV